MVVFYFITRVCDGKLEGDLEEGTTMHIVEHRGQGKARYMRMKIE
jgi:hypothetical protein